MIIEVPWNIGDKGFALYEVTNSTNKMCSSCNHSHRANIRISEVRECIIDGFQIFVDKQTKIWYRVAFNNGTYGATVEYVWKTKEEADNEVEISR